MKKVGGVAGALVFVLAGLSVLTPVGPAQAQSLQGRVTALEAAVATLQAQLAAEVAARQAADTTLQNNINGEVAARISGINALTSCSDASFNGTYFFESFYGSTDRIVSGKGTLVADGHRNLTFHNGGETQDHFDGTVDLPSSSDIDATYAVNADCTMTVTAGDEHIPFVLLPGGAIAVETSANSTSRMGIGGIAIRH